MNLLSMKVMRSPIDVHLIKRTNPRVVRYVMVVTRIWNNGSRFLSFLVILLVFMLAQ